MGIVWLSKDQCKVSDESPICRVGGKDGLDGVDMDFIEDADDIPAEVDILSPIFQSVSSGMRVFSDASGSAHLSDRKSTRLNSSHSGESRMPSSA